MADARIYFSYKQRAQKNRMKQADPNQQANIHTLLAALLDTPDAIRRLGKWTFDPDHLPASMPLEAAFMRVFYDLAGDRMPGILDQGQTPPVVITRQEMEANLSTMRDIGPDQAHEFLDELLQHKPEGTTVAHLARSVCQWVKRDARQNAFEKAWLVFADDMLTEEDQWQQAMDFITPHAPAFEGKMHTFEGESMFQAFEQDQQERYAALDAGRQTGPRLPWGLRKKVPSLRKNNLTVFSAKAGHGKSTVALQLAHEVAHAQIGYDVVYFFLETSSVDTFHRLVASNTLVPTDDLLDPSTFRLFGDKPLEKAAAAKYRAWKARYLKAQAERGRVWFVHCPDITFADLKAQVALYKQMSKARGRDLMVIIDYYDLISPVGITVAGRERHDINNALADRLKILAEQFELYLVVFAQDNLDADYSKKKTSAEGQRLYARCQVWVRILREEAVEDLLFPIDAEFPAEEGNTLRDATGQPVYWHRAKELSSFVTFRVDKANSNVLGPVDARIQNGFFRIFGTA